MQPQPARRVRLTGITGWMQLLLQLQEALDRRTCSLPTTLDRIPSRRMSMQPGRSTLGRLMAQQSRSRAALQMMQMQHSSPGRSSSQRCSCGTHQQTPVGGCPPSRGRTEGLNSSGSRQQW